MGLYYRLKQTKQFHLQMRQRERKRKRASEHLWMQISNTNFHCLFAWCVVQTRMSEIVCPRVACDYKASSCENHNVSFIMLILRLNILHNVQSFKNQANEWMNATDARHSQISIECQCSCCWALYKLFVWGCCCCHCYCCHCLMVYCSSYKLI